MSGGLGKLVINGKLIPLHFEMCIYGYFSYKIGIHFDYKLKKKLDSLLPKTFKTQAINSPSALGIEEGLEELM